MRSAFTLIEILLVVSIIGILSAITIPNVGKFADINIIDQAVQNVAANVEIVKYKAQSGAYANGLKATHWGVTFCPSGNTSTYELYGILENNDRVDTRVVQLESGITFAGSCNNIQVLFERLSSRPSDGNSKSVVITKNSYQRQLSVDGNTGKVIITK